MQSQGHFLARQPSQFFVDQWQELFGGLRFALFDCGEEFA